MQRRDFIAACAGAVPIAFTAVSEQIPEHEYDWNGSGTSTDPRMPVLAYGDDAPLVSLNGVIMNDSGLKITRCKSGNDGWVEYIKLDSKGKIMTHRDRNELVRGLLHGVVKVTPR